MQRRKFGDRYLNAPRDPDTERLLLEFVRQSPGGNRSRIEIARHFEMESRRIWGLLQNLVDDGKLEEMVGGRWAPASPG